VFFLLCVSFTPTASAQYGQSRSTWFPQHRPSALSPYLEMQRVTSSELDSYNLYVKPRLEMERLFMAQQREMARQKDYQKSMQKDITQVRSYQQRTDYQDYQMPSGATPTGKGVAYGNYLHYYPQRR
jgi:hypothetical protein